MISSTGDRNISNGQQILAAWEEDLQEVEWAVQQLARPLFINAALFTGCLISSLANRPNITFGLTMLGLIGNTGFGAACHLARVHIQNRITKIKENIENTTAAIS